MNLSGNELSLAAVERILSKMRSGFHLETLTLHTNNLGGKFSMLKDRCRNDAYVDFGEERYVIFDVIMLVSLCPALGLLFFFLSRGVKHSGPTAPSAPWVQNFHFMFLIFFFALFVFFLYNKYSVCTTHSVPPSKSSQMKK